MHRSVIHELRHLKTLQLSINTVLMDQGRHEKGILLLNIERLPDEKQRMEVISRNLRQVSVIAFIEHNGG